MRIVSLFRSNLIGAALSESAVVNAAPPSSATWYADYLRDARQVAIGHDRSLNLYCIGSGSPTVILESGLGGYAFDWWAVQGGIASFTRVCAYDRAGMGMSPPGPFPRDTNAHVADLEALLKAAELRPPYVLVGHSMGAYTVRVFASRHRRDVAGIVFVDPSIENQLAEIYAALPNIAESDNRSRSRIAACADPARTAEIAEDCARATPNGFTPALADAFARTQGLASSQAFESEAQSFTTRDSPEVIAASRHLGTMPMIVLTRTELSTNMTKDQAELEWKLWNGMHDRLAKLSSIGVNRPVPGAGHYIQLDKPDAVIRAVSEVVATERRTKARR